MAKHSFVVAVMILVFLLLIGALFKIATMYLSKIKNDSIANVQCMKAEIDKDVIRIESQLKSQLTEIDGVKDNIHRLSGAITNNNARISQVADGVNTLSSKMDMILIKLGADPIKMAQDK